MQSIEGEAWRGLALQLAHAAWDGYGRDAVAAILGLGEPDDLPYHSDLRKNYPTNLTYYHIAEAAQRRIMQTVGKEFARFGLGAPDMPSQWADPTPVLGIRSLAQHAGINEDSVRAAIRRGALPDVKLDGNSFIRVADAEEYFRAWDSEKSERGRT